MELPLIFFFMMRHSPISALFAYTVFFLFIFSSTDMLLVPLYLETDPVISSEVLGLPTSVVLSPVAPDSGFVSVVNSMEMELPSSSVVWLDNSSIEDDKAAAVSVIVIFSSSDMLLVSLYLETDPVISSEVLGLPTSVRKCVV